MHAFSVQLAWANELLEVHLQRASKQLLDISTTANGDGTSQDLKLQLDALVKQITACFVGVQSCIPEPLSPAAARPSSGTSLTTPAQVLLLPVSVHLMACGSCKTRVAAQYSSSHSEGCLKHLPCMSVITLHLSGIACPECRRSSLPGRLSQWHCGIRTRKCGSSAKNAFLCSMPLHERTSSLFTPDKGGDCGRQFL